MRRECVVGLIKREKKIAAKMSAVLFWAVVLDDVFVDRQRRQRFIFKPHGALVCLLFSACSLHLPAALKPTASSAEQSPSPIFCVCRVWTANSYYPQRGWPRPDPFSSSPPHHHGQRIK